MKRILFIFLCLFVVIAPSELYAQYCNNPTGVTMTRSGTTVTITWNSNGSAYYYWCVKTSTPFGSGTWPGPGSLANDYTSGVISVEVPDMPATGILYAYVAGVNSAWEWCAPSAEDVGAPAAPPNTPPVANNDTYNRFYTNTGVSFSVPASGVLGNDTDNENDPLIAVLNTGVSHGSLAFNGVTGSFTYTSTSGYKDNSDSFTYYANDGTVNSSTAATVTINIYTPRFIGGGGNNNFSNPANWNCGYVPTESLNIIIAAGQTMVVDQDYTCKTLKFESGSSFNCTGGKVLTITGDVLDNTDKIVIDVVSSIKVRSSIEIQNVGGLITE